MKDAQVTTASAEPRVFLLSPTLHCVSMTALVFLRSSFGYAFLRPKSVFFAVSWAFILFAIYAWIDGEAWAERRALLWFGIAAVVLYWLHFTATISREWRGSGRHDSDSGTSHTKLLSRMVGVSHHGHFDRKLRLLIEPGIIVALGTGFHFIAAEQHLSAWLLFTAFCLWIKEVLNQWFSIRREKRGHDIADDLGETFGDPVTNTTNTCDPPKATRKPQIHRRRIR